MSVTYQELIQAIYKPDQIIFCPDGDPCPCELKGPQRGCKFVLTPAERSRINDHEKPMVGEG